MELPLINLPVVYHRGTLDPAHRGIGCKHSQEGTWLSTSLCPQAWEQIVRLGGTQCWALTRPDAYYLDFHALPKELLTEILEWARAQGLVKPVLMYEVRTWNQDFEQWVTIFCSTEEEALAEVDDARECGYPDGHAPGYVANPDFYALTAAGRARAHQDEIIQPATTFAAQFWLEDELIHQMPQVAGILFNDRLDMDLHSAPKIAIVPSALESYVRTEVDPILLKEDDELLATMPASRWITPGCPIDAFTKLDLVPGLLEEDVENMMADYTFVDLTVGQARQILDVGVQGRGAQLLAQDAPGQSTSPQRAVTYQHGSYLGAPCVFTLDKDKVSIFNQPSLAGARMVERAYTAEVDDQGSLAIISRQRL